VQSIDLEDSYKPHRIQNITSNTWKDSRMGYTGLVMVLLLIAGTFPDNDKYHNFTLVYLSSKATSLV